MFMLWQNYGLGKHSLFSYISGKLILRYPSVGRMLLHIDCNFHNLSNVSSLHIDLKNQVMKCYATVFI